MGQTANISAVLFLLLASAVQDVCMVALTVSLSSDIFPPSISCTDKIAVKFVQSERPGVSRNRTKTVMFQYKDFSSMSVICLNDGTFIEPFSYYDMSITVNGTPIRWQRTSRVGGARYTEESLVLLSDELECPRALINYVSTKGARMADEIPKCISAAAGHPVCAPPDLPKALPCPVCPVPLNCETATRCLDQLAPVMASTDVTKVGFAPVIVPGKLLPVTVGPRINMSCTVTAKPKPNIFWVFENIRTEMTVLTPQVLDKLDWKTSFRMADNDTIEARLHIESTEDRDFKGVFRCFAVNDWGQASEAFVLQKYIPSESFRFSTIFTKGPFRKIQDYLTYEVYYIPVV